MTVMATDLELLEIEIETLWVKDRRGRLVESRESNGRTAPHLVIAASNDGQIAAIGSEVADALAAELQAAVAGGSPSPGPETQPASIARCGQLLKGSLGPVDLSAGPSYVVHPRRLSSPQWKSNGQTARAPMLCGARSPSEPTGAPRSGVCCSTGPSVPGQSPPSEAKSSQFAIPLGSPIAVPRPASGLIPTSVGRGTPRQ